MHHLGGECITWGEGWRGWKPRKYWACDLFLYGQAQGLRPFRPRTLGGADRVLGVPVERIEQAATGCA